ncbi:uncharacterized protein CLUP02_09945 [Colletotrichum lupini]|uniref:Uncharacterized protein n=1 Tax=Colletotrichum lupini TaxID=145971 RepID=A0A9Q8SVX3_9PEZI|nr:uncharacterized protein CLUP02_09945 [Colletotrichum lupini]UQC84448.1 hypothetical protein CLUP02_09945 [Colletotrichum lupini]
MAHGAHARAGAASASHEHHFGSLNWSPGLALPSSWEPGGRAGAVTFMTEASPVALQWISQQREDSVPSKGKRLDLHSGWRMRMMKSAVRPTQFSYGSNPFLLARLFANAVGQIEGTIHGNAKIRHGRRLTYFVVFNPYLYPMQVRSQLFVFGQIDGPSNTPQDTGCYRPTAGLYCTRGQEPPLSHRIDFTALVEENLPGLQRDPPTESECPAPGGAASGKKGDVRSSVHAAGFTATSPREMGYGRRMQKALPEPTLTLCLSLAYYQPGCQINSAREEGRQRGVMYRPTAIILISKGQEQLCLCTRLTCGGKWDLDKHVRGKAMIDSQDSTLNGRLGIVSLLYRGAGPTDVPIVAFSTLAETLRRVVFRSVFVISVQPQYQRQISCLCIVPVSVGIEPTRFPPRDGRSPFVDLARSWFLRTVSFRLDFIPQNPSGLRDPGNIKSSGCSVEGTFASVAFELVLLVQLRVCLNAIIIYVSPSHPSRLTFPAHAPGSLLDSAGVSVGALPTFSSKEFWNFGILWPLRLLSEYRSRRLVSIDEGSFLASWLGAAYVEEGVLEGLVSRHARLSRQRYNLLCAKPLGVNLFGGLLLADVDHHVLSRR